MEERTSKPYGTADKLRIIFPVLRNAAARGVVLLALLCLSCRIQAQGAAATPPVHPEFKWLVDAPLLAAGSILLVVGNPQKVTVQYVPPEGLDPGKIHWSLDRRAVGERSTQADKESDYFRDAAVAYPVLLAIFGTSSGERGSGTLRRSLEYVEAILLSDGISSVTKNLTDRPRPYTYLPADLRPSDPAYDVTADEAFRSMPSGHTVVAFTAAGFAMTDYLISRPEASWQARAGVAFIGGFLAGITAGTRVEAGQHFPSDTMVSAVIGTTSGVTIPLVHHYVGADGRQAAWPSAHAWWQAIAGEALGVGAGLLTAKLY